MPGHGIVTQAAPTAAPPQTQNYTKTGLGTPKGYLALGSLVTTLNTITADWLLSIGASDFTTDNMMMTNMEDNQATSDNAKIHQSDELVRIATAGSSTGVEVAVDNGTVTDGVQMSWSATNVARQVSAILFEEGIEDFDVQTPLLNGTGATTITTGFQPDLMIMFTVGNTGEFGSNEGEMIVSLVSREGPNYSSCGFDAVHGDTTPSAGERHSTTVIGGAVNAPGNFFETWTVSNFTSTGFDMDKVSGTAQRDITIVSLKLKSGYAGSVGTFSAPTVTGVDSSITGLDHKPQLAFFLANNQTAAAGSSAVCGMSFGACEADNECVIGGRYEDLDATANTDTDQAHRTDACLFHMNDVGTIDSQASLDSFTEDGVDLNFSTASRAILVGYMTIGKRPIGVPLFHNKRPSTPLRM